MFEIVETVTWRLLRPPAQAGELIAAAFDALGMSVERDGDIVRARSASNMLRNRRKGKLEAHITADADNRSLVVISIDVSGDSHGIMFNEIYEQLPADAVANDGIDDAVAALPKQSRLSARTEIKHLRSQLELDERVEAIAEGTHNKRHGILVLTNERVFFFERATGRRKLEQFDLGAISSITDTQSFRGDTITISASGADTQIKKVGLNNQATAFATAYRTAKARRSVASATPTPGPAPAPPAAPVPAADPLEQIERLGQLRERGLISDDEYEAKKTELLRRL